MAFLSFFCCYFLFDFWIHTNKEMFITREINDDNCIWYDKHLAISWKYFHRISYEWYAYCVYTFLTNNSIQTLDTTDKMDKYETSFKIYKTGIKLQTFEIKVTKLANSVFFYSFSIHYRKVQKIKSLSVLSNSIANFVNFVTFISRICQIFVIFFCRVCQFYCRFINFQGSFVIISDKILKTSRGNSFW